MDSGSDSDGELGGLFAAPDDSDYSFYFAAMSTKKITASTGVSTEVTFEFSYNRGRPMHSRMVLGGELDDSHRKHLLSIGMCVLPWFWMGFATKRIIIEVEGVTDLMIRFFSTLYSNVLLEFCERNATSFPSLERSYEEPSFEPVPVESRTTAESLTKPEKSAALIPLGGLRCAIAYAPTS